MGQDGKGKVMLESMIDIHLSNLKKIDNMKRTNFYYTHKSMMWWLMNEAEKPFMKTTFSNGRMWRKIKDKFLFIPR